MARHSVGTRRPKNQQDPPHNKSIHQAAQLQNVGIYNELAVVEDMAAAGLWNVERVQI